MTAEGAYDIKIARLALGLAVGALVAIAYFAIQAFSAWPLVATVGAGLAAVLVPLVGAPVYLLLRRTAWLNVYVVIFAGGCLTLLPYLAFETMASWGGDTTFAQVDQTVHIENGKFTTAGLLYTFVWAPLWFFAGGALGGAVAWLVAVGARIRAPRRA